MSKDSRWQIFCKYCMITICLITAPSVAAAPQDAEKQSILLPEFLTYFDALDHETYSMRSEAHLKLSQAILDDAQIIHLFQNVGSYEQLHRLLQITRHWFIRSQIKPTSPDAKIKHGAIGMNFSQIASHQDPRIKHPAIQVTRTLPGFPAYQHIIPGDLIIAINHQPTNHGFNLQRFAQEIRNLKLDSVVTFDLLRKNQTLTRSITLSSYTQLTRIYPINTTPTGELAAPIESAWQMYRKQMLSHVSSDLWPQQ
ncbi:PDZ domain-containing protein [Poriferisphaera sp. WC338]|uniref:PDZ domain-containing protein n=1 Tax=Poriferisphaera sp. WC338 TaxID=3425129 RepID=UPI003D81460F